MDGFGDAVQAAKEGRHQHVRELVRADPALLVHRDDERHALLDHALWALIVPDWSRPVTFAPDPDGARLGLVRFLLDEGADPNGKGEHDWTPLHTALYENHVEATRVLLSRGASPRAEVYGDGGTPLLQALFWGHAEAADVLAEHDIHPRNLRVAAGLGRRDPIAEAFAEDGTLRPEAGAHRGYYRPHEDFPRWTPSDDPQEILDEALTYATRSGRAVEVLEDPVARGADVDGAPYNGAALHWAASKGYVEICRWLLDHGADVNRRAAFGAQHGVTPLHCAAWVDQLEAVTLLVQRGADAAIRDETHDGTPRDWALHMGAAHVAGYLAEPE